MSTPEQCYAPGQKSVCSDIPGCICNSCASNTAGGKYSCCGAHWKTAMATGDWGCYLVACPDYTPEEDRNYADT